jgi:Kef-type K+ transport system membrane component KefB
MLLSLSIVLACALLSGQAAKRLGQPAVLGELIAGIALGAVPQLSMLKHEPAVDILSELGVLVLLFQVGLESSVGAMMQVGASSLKVAVVGVAAPFALGWGVGAWLLPGQSVYAHAFVGATLCATSVGITARVLKDLQRSGARESRIILGAAVIDDVLGLVILAAVSGAIAAANAGEPFSFGTLVVVVVKALAFLGAAVLIGLWVAPRVAVHPVPALLFCFITAWASGAVGLSPIVGAFAAGLVIRSEPLERSVAPIASVLVPFFFVRMGLNTDLRVFLDARTVLLALALTVAAVAGKLVSGWGAREKALDRLTLGIGMIPRGEVGLIFAGVGLTLTAGGSAVVDERVYGAVVAMVLATTLLTPPALVWRLKRVPARSH